MQPVLQKSLTALGILIGLFSQTVPVQAATDWYWVKSKGKAVGTLSIHSYPQLAAKTNDSKSLKPTGNIITEVENRNSMSRMGNEFTVGSTSRFEENAVDGNPVRFSHSYHLSDQDASEASGELQGEKIAMEVRQYDTQMSGTTPIEKGNFSFPTGERIKRVFKEHYHDTVGKSFTFQTLHLALAPNVVAVQATVMNEEDLMLPGGVRKKLRRFSIINPKQPDNIIYEWRDAEGKLFKAKAKKQDTELVYVAEPPAKLFKEKKASKEAKTIAGPKAQAYTIANASKISTKPSFILTPTNQLDVITSTMVRTNRLIPLPRQVKNGYYLISLKGSARQPVIPQDGRQKIIKSSQNGLYVRITPNEPKDALATYPIAFSSRYLGSNSYIQSNDPEIRDIAQTVTKGELRAYYAARRLQKWVNTTLQNKNLSQGFASAKETLSMKQGDCTEHAVLLAALTRAIGIPSRVAVGVEYLPTGQKETGSFVYHMWTEVYIGQPGAKDAKGDWIALDATNPEAIVDATHIKLAESDLADPNAPITLSEEVFGMMGQLKIDVLEAHEKLAHTEITLTPKNNITPTQIQNVNIQAIDVQQMSKRAVKQFRVAIPQEDAWDNTLEGYLGKGSEQLYQGNYTQAMALFDKASSEAKVPMAHFYLGERLAGMELFSRAREEFDKAKRADPLLGRMIDPWIREFFPTTTLPRGLEQAYFQAISQDMNQDTAGTANYDDILQSAPAFTPALLRQGKSAMASGKYPEALKAFSNFTQRVSNDPRGPQGLSQTYERMNKFPLAVQEMKKANVLASALQSPGGKNLAKDIAKQLLVVQGRALVAKNSRSVPGWLDIGKGLYAQRRPGEALTAFNNAIVYSRPYATSVGLAYKMRILLETGDWDQAQIIFPRLQQRAGNNPFANAMLGYYQTRMRNYQSAQTYLKRSIALAPHRLEGYKYLSDLYTRRNSPKSAEAIMRKGMEQLKISNLSTFEDSLAVRYHLALLIYKDKPAEAYKLLDEILEKHALYGKAYALQGQIRLNQNQLRDAKEALSNAVVLEPYDPNILTRVGDLYSVLGDTNEALYYYEKALKTVESHPESSRALALLIEEQQLNREKPRLYLEVNADEKDYLIQLARNCQHYQETTKAFRTGSNEINQSATSLFDRKIEIINHLESFYKNLAEQYRWTQSITPPERFANIHFQMSSVIYASLNFMDTFESEFADLFGSFGESSLEKNAAVTAATQNLIKLTQTLDQTQASIFLRLNPIVRQEIQEIAGINLEKGAAPAAAAPPAAAPPQATVPAGLDPNKIKNSFKNASNPK